MRRHKHPSKRQLLEVEMLLTESQRRVTVDEHQAFRESLRPDQIHDEIDHAAADIMPARIRTERQASRLTRILDELDAEDRKGGAQ